MMASFHLFSTRKWPGMQLLTIILVSIEFRPFTNCCSEKLQLNLTICFGLLMFLLPFRRWFVNVKSAKTYKNYIYVGYYNEGRLTFWKLEPFKITLPFLSLSGYWSSWKFEVCRAKAMSGYRYILLLLFGSAAAIVSIDCIATFVSIILPVLNDWTQSSQSQTYNSLDKRFYILINYW